MQLHTERQRREEYPVRYGQESPEEVEAGRGWVGEHGPGAARAKGSPRRVRPSSRRSVLALRKASAARRT